MKTSSSSHDLYARLGIGRDSSKHDIQNAIAKQEHPDKNPGNPEANQRFQKAVEAYSILTDDYSRCLYDFVGYTYPYATHTSYTSSTSTTGDYYANSSHYSQTTTYSTNPPNNNPPNTNNSDSPYLSSSMPPPSPSTLPTSPSIPTNYEIKSEFSSTTNSSNSNNNTNCGSGVFTPYTNTNNTNSSSPLQKPSQLQPQPPSSSSYTQHYSYTNFSFNIPHYTPKAQIINVNCTLNELYSGCTKQLKLKDNSKKVAFVEVEIPKGSSNGTILKTPISLRNQLDYDPKSIQFVVKEIQHKKYKRVNNDLIYEVEINWKDALIGTEITIPTIDGRIVKKHIDCLKTSNSTMVIPKCGMIYINEETNSFEKGDMIVKFNIVFDNLNEEMKNELKKFSI